MANRRLDMIGVGAGINPPQWLVPGTKMAVHISNIGTLRNEIVFSDE